MRIMISNINEQHNKGEEIDAKYEYRLATTPELSPSLLGPLCYHRLWCYKRATRYVHKLCLLLLHFICHILDIRYAIIRLFGIRNCSGSGFAQKCQTQYTDWSTTVSLVSASIIRSIHSSETSLGWNINAMTTLTRSIRCWMTSKYKINKNQFRSSIFNSFIFSLTWHIS